MYLLYLINNSLKYLIQTTFKSKQVKEKDEDTKISTKNLAIKPARLSVIKRRFVIGQPTPGLLPLKERIREVRAMKKCVYAKQSFGIVISDEVRIRLCFSDEDELADEY